MLCWWVGGRSVAGSETMTDGGQNFAKMDGGARRGKSMAMGGGPKSPQSCQVSKSWAGRRMKQDPHRSKKQQSRTLLYSLD